MIHARDEVAVEHSAVQLDSGLRALCGIAGYYRIAADPHALRRELSLTGPAGFRELLRASRTIGVKAKLVVRTTPESLAQTPVPAIVKLRESGFVVYGGPSPNGLHRIVDPVTSADRYTPAEDLIDLIEPQMMLVARRIGGKGSSPTKFGLEWILASISRYRKALAHVLLASLFVQIFALTTPLFFQVVVDKVVAHRGYSTLIVLVAALLVSAIFDVYLQYLRTYALAHTANRIDVELGQRLLKHLLQLPISYFEERPAGQTVARVRELETIRSFMTGPGLFAALDLAFTFVLLSVCLAISWKLSLIVIGAVPLHVLVATFARPALQRRVNDKFNAGAVSQQFLVETVVGIQTVKSAAVEPFVQAEWEERLAHYVKASFLATLAGAIGQNGVQYITRATTALIMLFGALAAMDGEMSIGALVAFNMIAAQVAQPVIRLAQVWQDFQQAQVSMERLSDILNATPEPRTQSQAAPPPPRGEITFQNVTFRYKRSGTDVLRGVSLQIRPGEVVGIVGPSGSGKSTLTKLIQRLYIPQEGRILLDGADLASADPAWLRSNIGVVLQENLLFNRTVHDNIAFSNPGLSRSRVVAIAQLAGADEFIARLPMGYDTVVDERGGNLSGGQRQRVAIARALAANPPILIFDEATSALDYESERIIQRNMRLIARDRTVLIIAHRLGTVRTCDRIIGMNDGRIVEIGSHDDLVGRADGLYRKLWMLQNEGAAA